MTRIGEMSMRPKQSPHHYLRSKAFQFDLFAQPDDGQPDDSAARMPDWRTLPAETRQALTTLMVHLILEHKQGDQRLREEEAHDDV